MESSSEGDKQEQDSNAYVMEDNNNFSEINGGIQARRNYQSMLNLQSKRLSLNNVNSDNALFKLAQEVGNLSIKEEEQVPLV